ncbi:tetratricopeptide repeat protein [bacterium]|nr:tetratricopeptide repeat protein [bacterium]
MALAQTEPAVYELFYESIQDLDIFTVPFGFNPEETAFGDELFENGLYYDAVTEYKRFLFYHPETPLENYLHYKMALAQLRQGEFSGGIQNLEYLIYLSDDQEVSYNASLILVLTHIRLGHFFLAEYEIIDKISTYNVPSKLVELFYWYGWLFLLQGRWDEAREAFMEIIEMGDTESQYYYGHAYALVKEMKLQPENIEHRSEGLAKWLSAVVPGSGQIYAGKWKEGINSLLLNTAFGYLTGRTLVNEKFFQSAVIFYLLWSRYYFGSSYNAEKIAIEYNQTKSQQLIVYLINKYLKS